MKGTCALCQKDADLQKSHLLPKWVYRRICAVDPTGPRAPIYVAKGDAVLSSRQTTRHLLCIDCEQRFSKSEHYLEKLTSPENEQIMLFKNVTQLPMPNDTLALLNQNEDGDHIAYFAASVMWRACVMTGGCTLGSYEPNFRKYLLGETQFPGDASLTVGLFRQSPNVDTRGVVSEPCSAKTDTGWVHGFLLAGLVFRCWVGKNIPPGFKKVSLAGPNSKKFVSILEPERCPDFLTLAEVVATATLRGKLAGS